MDPDDGALPTLYLKISFKPGAPEGRPQRYFCYHFVLLKHAFYTVLKKPMDFLPY